MLTAARRAQLGLIAAGLVMVFCLAVLGIRAAERNMYRAAEAPSFVRLDTNGHRVSLADHTGKIVVLAFGSVQCPGTNSYCRRLADFAREYQATGQVDVFMVDASGRSDEQYLRELRVHQSVVGQPFPTLLDESRAMMRAYGVEKTPCIVVIDQHGQIRYRGAFDNHPDPNKVTRHYCAEMVGALLPVHPQVMTSTQAFGRLAGLPK